jgi:hypothetical protein
VGPIQKFELLLRKIHSRLFHLCMRQYQCSVLDSDDVHSQCRQLLLKPCMIAFLIGELHLVETLFRSATEKGFVLHQFHTEISVIASNYQFLQEIITNNNILLAFHGINCGAEVIEHVNVPTMPCRKDRDIISLVDHGLCLDFASVWGKSATRRMRSYATAFIDR